MSVKRTRNFTDPEVEALVSGVETRKSVIKGKISRINVSIEMRRRAWTEITEEVNSVCVGSPSRTVEEVKKKYTNIRSAVRVKDNMFRNDVAKGIQPLSKLSHIEQRVSALWDEQPQAEAEVEDWAEHSSDNSVELLSEPEHPQVLFVDVPNMVPDPVVGRHVATQTISSGEKMDPRTVQGEQQLALLETMSYSMARQAAAMETVAGFMGQCLELLKNQNNK